MNLLGMKFTEKGIEFAPIGSLLTEKVELSSLKYRNAILNIVINGNGNVLKSFKINGKETEPFVPYDICGNISIEIALG